MSLEDSLKIWASPPSDTEQTKADNAERVVREALRGAQSLSPYHIEVIPQGSYKANTNTRLNSDVDLCVLCTDVYFYDLSLSDLAERDLPGGTAPLTYSHFRSMVEAVLVSRFGRSSVVRGNKALDIHANSYRLDADVIVAFEHRRFNTAAVGGWQTGIQFLPDNGPLIVNWPQQTYDNGVAKNARTGRRYKAAIRILKRLRDAMHEKGRAEARDIGSFMIESLVWNVPDSYFDTPTYADMMQSVLAHTFNATLADKDCADWGEVNELKYVLRGASVLRQRVNGFLGAAWDYLGYK